VNRPEIDHEDAHRERRSCTLLTFGMVEQPGDEVVLGEPVSTKTVRYREHVDVQVCPASPARTGSPSPVVRQSLFSVI
jgi:hypothetical protein